MAATLDMTAPASTYRQRRATLASSLHRPLILFAGQPRARHYATNVHPFRAASNYLYFGGPPLAGSALVIEPGSDGESGSFLARPLTGFDDEVWLGASPSDAELSTASGLAAASFIEPDALGKRLGDRTAGFFAPPCPPTVEWAGELGLTPATPDELQAIIAIRLIKDEHELKAMRRAAKIGVDAHLAAMKATRPGVGEADIVGAFMQVLTAERSILSFTPIVTIHGEVLHCETYPGTLEAGNLLLVDAGAEEPGGYASDITRTYPVNGQYTDMQRQLCGTVVRAKEQAIAACVPGTRYRDVHDLAAKVICEGLVEAGLLTGDPAELTARKAHTLFFTHGLGHLIGLDVHDMEDFGDLAGYASDRERRPDFGDKSLRLDRDLEPGVALTIEPGLYLVPAIWRNDEFLAPFADVINKPAIEALVADGFGGIRMEDTVCVRAADAGGPEVLSAELPNDLDAMAALVGAD